VSYRALSFLLPQFNSIANIKAKKKVEEKAMAEEAYVEDVMQCGLPSKDERLYARKGWMA